MVCFCEALSHWRHIAGVSCGHALNPGLNACTPLKVSQPIQPIRKNVCFANHDHHATVSRRIHPVNVCICSPSPRIRRVKFRRWNSFGRFRWVMVFMSATISPSLKCTFFAHLCDCQGRRDRPKSFTAHFLNPLGFFFENKNAPMQGCVRG